MPANSMQLRPGQTGICGPAEASGQNHPHQAHRHQQGAPLSQDLPPQGEDAHPSALKSVLESANPAWTRSVHLDAPGQRRGQQPVSGTADPGVVKQDKSSRGSVGTTKTCSDPQRVRMSSGERPIGAAKGKQSDTEALCQPSPLFARATPLSEPRQVLFPKLLGLWCCSRKGRGGRYVCMTVLVPQPAVPLHLSTCVCLGAGVRYPCRFACLGAAAMPLLLCVAVPRPAPPPLAGR